MVWHLRHTPGELNHPCAALSSRSAPDKSGPTPLGFAYSDPFSRLPIRSHPTGVHVSGLSWVSVPVQRYRPDGPGCPGLCLPSTFPSRAFSAPQGFTSHLAFAALFHAATTRRVFAFRAFPALAAATVSGPLPSCHYETTTTADEVPEGMSSSTSRCLCTSSGQVPAAAPSSPRRCVRALRLPTSRRLGHPPAGGINVGSSGDRALASVESATGVARHQLRCRFAVKRCVMKRAALRLSSAGVCRLSHPWSDEARVAFASRSR